MVTESNRAVAKTNLSRARDLRHLSRLPSSVFRTRATGRDGLPPGSSSLDLSIASACVGSTTLARFLGVMDSEVALSLVEKINGELAGLRVSGSRRFESSQTGIRALAAK